MNKALHALIGAVLLAGCAQGPGSPAETASMPNNPQGGPELNQGQAIGLAGWALANPANTAGKPARAARAIAAEEWLAGQTILYGNFDGYAPSGQVAWQQLRQQARGAIGVAPTASSQEVVDRLLRAADALKAKRTDEARAALSAPIFTLGPDRTLEALAHLPPLPATTWAFTELQENENREFGNGPPLFR